MGLTARLDILVATGVSRSFSNRPCEDPKLLNLKPAALLKHHDVTQVDVCDELGRHASSLRPLNER